MTKIIKKRMYCNKCKKYYTVPVVLSTNSYMLERDERLKQRAHEGNLFKNYCPECKEEMVDKDE